MTVLSRRIGRPVGTTCFGFFALGYYCRRIADLQLRQGTLPISWGLRHSAAMGKFDGSIEWLRKQMENAAQALLDLKAGRKLEISGRDVTK
jgi:hypothetical protein